jgi:dihydrofolate synthase/folylpolyglutamate synthase
LHQILSDAGYRTGLYTSPHLTFFTERIRIDDTEIAEHEVVEIAEEIWRTTETATIPLTFFEFVTVMAFVYFARRAIEIAVIEVGLGGRLDATNVIKPLVSAITTISKDHEAYLGPDEISIANEKGGIIKPGVPCVCGKLTDEIRELLQEIAHERGSRAYFMGRDFNFFLKNGGLFDYRGIKHHFSDVDLALPGRYQRANATIALAAIELAEDRFPVSEAAIRGGLRRVRWPGRLEVIGDRPTVILDGAHNPEGVRALIDELKDLRQGRKIKLLFAAMADKEWELMLRMLGEAVDEVTLARVDMERCADPVLMASKLDPGITHRVIADSRQALRTLLAEAGEGDLVVVAGSLYLLGEVRPLLQESASQNR